MCNEAERITQNRINLFMKFRKSEKDDSRQCRRIISQLQADLIAAKRQIKELKKRSRFNQQKPNTLNTSS